MGLEAAGKTTTLYRLRLGESISTQPTLGSNVEELQIGNLRLECWDLGGQDSLRESWAAYFSNTDGVVLVVDCANRADLNRVKRELSILLVNEDLKDAPLLILGNKQDLPDALSPAQLSHELDVNNKVIRRSYHVQGCCAVTGDGLQSGFEWLANAIASQPPKSRG